MATTRRGFLTSLAGGLTALGTGCVGSSGSGGSRTTTITDGGSRSPTATPSTTATNPLTATPSSTAATTGREHRDPGSERTRTTGTRGTTDDVPVWEPPACDEEVHRLSSPIDEVRYGSLGEFSLTASETTIVRGETTTVRLENTAGSEKMTGNKRKYDIQRRTADGWRSVYWVPENYEYNDIGIMHPSGTGFTWEFSFARDSLERSTQFNTPYSVCEPITPGEYRFVYWGLTSKAERESDFETEYAIGVRFTVEQPATTVTGSE